MAVPAAARPAPGLTLATRHSTAGRRPHLPLLRAARPLLLLVAQGVVRPVAAAARSIGTQGGMAANWVGGSGAQWTAVWTCLRCCWGKC